MKHKPHDMIPAASSSPKILCPREGLRLFRLWVLFLITTGLGTAGAAAQDAEISQPAILSVDPLVEAGAEAGNVDIPVHIRLDRPASADFVLMAELTSGTATVGTDAAPLVAAIPFSRGDLSKMVTVDVLDDELDEAAEEILQLELSLASEVPDVVIATPITPLVIRDDDTRLRLSGDSTGPEGSTAMLRLEADNPPNTAVTLSLTIEDLGATPGEDFILKAGERVFPAGANNLEIPIPLLDDPIDEPEETFRVSLSTPDPRVRVAPDMVEVTIEGGCNGPVGPEGALVDEACQWWWTSAGPCHDYRAHGAKAWVVRGKEIRDAIRQRGGAPGGLDEAGWGVVLGSKASPSELAQRVMSGAGAGLASMNTPGTAILLALQGPETVYMRDLSAPEDGSGVSAQDGTGADNVSFSATYHPEHARVTGRFQGSGVTACDGRDVRVSFQGGFSLPYDPEEITLPDPPTPSAVPSSPSSGFEPPSRNMTDAELGKMIEMYEQLMEITTDPDQRRELSREIERLESQMRAGRTGR